MGTQLRKEDFLLWQAAIELFDEGDVDSAYESFCNMQEQPAPIVFNTAMFHVNFGNWPSAHELLTEVVTKDKHHVIGHFQRGVASHRLGRNEEALKDFEAALRSMHESDYINYTTLGLQYVFCRFYIHFNLAAVKMVLGLKEMSAESLAQAMAVKGRMEADETVRALASDSLLVPIPSLAGLAVEPCRMNHEHGICPMLCLPKTLLYRPAGQGERIVLAARAARKDYLREDKAKVLYASDQSQYVGFAGRRHTEQFQPMMINTGKPGKKNKKGKRPGEALSGLIRSVNPGIVFMAGERSRTSSASVAVRPQVVEEIKAAQRQRAQSMFVESTSRPDEEEEDRPAVSGDDQAQQHSAGGTQKQDSVAEWAAGQAHRTSTNSFPEEHKLSQAMSVEVLAPAVTTTASESSGIGSPPLDVHNRFLTVGDSKITRAHSVEVIVQDSAHGSEGSESDTASSSLNDGAGLPKGAGHMEINVQTQMTPTTLRDLAELLERLQSSERARTITVNVHMHQG